MLEVALAAVGGGVSAARALLLATLTSELEYARPLEARMALIEEALAIARHLDDPETLAFVLNRLCMSFAVPQTLDARRAAAAESAAIADGDGIERVAAETFELGSAAGEPDAFDYFAFALVAARWLQGRGIELSDQLREAAAANPGVPALVAARAELLADAGDRGPTAALLHAAAAQGFEYPVTNAWSAGVTAWSSAAEKIDDPTGADGLYELLAPFAGQFASNRVYCSGSFDATLGRLARLLGNHEAALAHFDAAEALNEGLDARFFAARDAVARAVTHLARGADGDRAAAEEHATRGLEIARANGYAAVEARASAFLAELAGT